MPNWALGVDLGSSSSSAAAWTEGRLQLLTVDGQNVVPSAILLQDETLVAGPAADELKLVKPAQIAQNPLRFVGSTPMTLGGLPVSAEAAIGGLLKLFVDSGSAAFGGTSPSALVLTYPVTWTADQQQVLRDAARALVPGVEPHLVPEPVAAAIQCAQLYGLAEGRQLAVYHLGGGGFAAAVVGRRDGVLRVLGAPAGTGDASGEIYDHVVYDLFGEQLGSSARDWWQHLASDLPEAGRSSAMLLDTARIGKEALTRGEEFVQYIPGAGAQVKVTRKQFDRRIAPSVDRTVQVTASTIESAGLRPDDLDVLFLTGGASVIPLADRKVRARFGKRVITAADPRTVAALGAAQVAGERMFGSPIGSPIEILNGAMPNRPPDYLPDYSYVPAGANVPASTGMPTGVPGDGPFIATPGFPVQPAPSLLIPIAMAAFVVAALAGTVILWLV